MATLKLVSSDNDLFEVPEGVGCMSETVKNIIEETGSEAPIRLLSVSSKILVKVIEFCKYHVENKDKLETDAAVKEWQKQFMTVDQVTLFDLTMAVKYLNIDSLLDLICQTIADMIITRTAEEVRVLFNIKNDLAPEEKAVHTIADMIITRTVEEVQVLFDIKNDLTPEEKAVHKRQRVR